LRGKVPFWKETTKNAWSFRESVRKGRGASPGKSGVARIVILPKADPSIRVSAILNPESEEYSGYFV